MTAGSARRKWWKSPVSFVRNWLMITPCRVTVMSALYEGSNRFCEVASIMTASGSVIEAWGPPFGSSSLAEESVVDGGVAVAAPPVAAGAAATVSACGSVGDLCGDGGSAGPTGILMRRLRASVHWALTRQSLQSVRPY